MYCTLRLLMWQEETGPRTAQNSHMSLQCNKAFWWVWSLSFINEMLICDYSVSQVHIILKVCLGLNLNQHSFKLFLGLISMRCFHGSSDSFYQCIILQTHRANLVRLSRTLMLSAVTYPALAQQAYSVEMSIGDVLLLTKIRADRNKVQLAFLSFLISPFFSQPLHYNQIERHNVVIFMLFVWITFLPWVYMEVIIWSEHFQTAARFCPHVKMQNITILSSLDTSNNCSLVSCDHVYKPLACCTVLRWDRRSW